MLHRQPSAKDQARKSWEAILGSRYFGPADFVAFDCASQEKAAHSHVIYAVQEVSKPASKGPKTAVIVPEMSVVR
jgi:hypothetical protein